MLIQDVYNPLEGDLRKQFNEFEPHGVENFKLSLIQKNLDIPFDQNKLKINYVSAVTGWAGAAGNGQSPKSFADYLNPRVVDCISKKESCYTGVILFDFIDENITKTVYSKNGLK